MGTDYRFRKKNCFYPSFLKLEPTILFSGRLKVLLVLVEQTFHLVEISLKLLS